MKVFSIAKTYTYGASLILRLWAAYICMLLLGLISSRSATKWPKFSKKLASRILLSKSKMCNPLSNRKKSQVPALELYSTQV